MTDILLVTAAIAAGAALIILLLKWLMRVSEARGHFGQTAAAATAADGEAIRA